MLNPLIRKLDVSAELPAEDCGLLRKVSLETRRVEASCDLTREGDRPQNVHLVLDGFACRYKIHAEGHRQSD